MLLQDEIEELKSKIKLVCKNIIKLVVTILLTRNIRGKVTEIEFKWKFIDYLPSD